jgi:phosphoribosylaminoimidazole carboxylase PurE protein
MLGCSSRQESRKTKIESEVWRVEKDSATKRPEIGVLLGSASDLDSVEPAFQILQDLQIPYEVAVISAHRTPHLLSEYASTAKGRGIKAIVAAAGLSAALPGAVASLVDLPVIGIPVDAGPLRGVDALISMAQMPPGVPVGAVGIGGAKNAALLAARILGTGDSAISEKLASYRKSQEEDTVRKGDLVSAKGLPQWQNTH